MAHLVRKTVTVVFCDVKGSTGLGERLDAESVRHVMGRYFEEMRAVIERHGGTVEKFIGDAVMAVFGIPVVHEDDALRAVRAALEMREALASINAELEREWGIRLAARIGVNTGEVVAGDPTRREGFATGDTVNVAARLEQTATPGEVVVGRNTYELVREAIEVAAVEPLALRGKEEPVLAYRVVRLVPEITLPARQFDSPLVDRVQELRQLEEAFEHAVAERSSRLFALVGAPGVGKSRLGAEGISRIADRAAMLVGRCLPYGEGITYWPVVEAVKQAAEIADGDPPGCIQAKLAALLGDGEEASLIAGRVAQVMGVAEATATSEETFWALRKLLERIARARPLVLLLEDVHWAEPTLLDLIEYIADWWRDTPLLVLCLARPELLDARPGWGRSPGTTSMLLEPLGERETDALIDNRPGGDELSESARARIKEAAEGNPLFVEQMLAAMAEKGAPDNAAVPPTIQTLLAARLDQLDTEERRVIERASVMGRSFWWEAVRELSPEEARRSVSEHLMGLVRKELIVPELGDSGREHSFRFRHILIRDAAYAGLPKEARSVLHERFAAWLEERGGEYQEIVGYHLEQAFRSWEQLGPIDDRARALAARAGRHLAAAGRRALSRGDMPAAANLFERASSLLPPEASERLELLPDLGRALTEIGALARADEVLSEAIESAKVAGNRRLRSDALVNRSVLRIYTQPDIERGTQELVQAAEEAVRVFEEHGDHLGLARAWGKLAEVHWTRCRYAAMEEVLERALAHAEQAGDEYERAVILSGLARAALLGPTPVEEGIRRCLTILGETRGNRRLEAIAGVMIAGLEAMRGRFSEARELYATSHATFVEFGLRRWIAGFPVWSGPAELLAGEPSRAEAQLREGYESLRAMGDRGLLSPVAAFLAQALCAQGRYDEADEFATTSEECASRDDLFPHVVWRGARAKVLARRDELVAARLLAREALELAEETDSLNLQADAWVDLAEVLRLDGDEPEAAVCVECALALYEAKDNIVSAANARALLAAVGGRA